MFLKIKRSKKNNKIKRGIHGKESKTNERRRRSNKKRKIIMNQAIKNNKKIWKIKKRN